MELLVSDEWFGLIAINPGGTRSRRTG